MKLSLVTKENGYDDYDVVGLMDIKRICVGRNLRHGDIVNVYHEDGRKTGAEWAGTVEATLERLAAANSRFSDWQATRTVESLEEFKVSHPGVEVSDQTASLIVYHDGGYIELQHDKSYHVVAFSDGIVTNSLSEAEEWLWENFSADYIDYDV